MYIDQAPNWVNPIGRVQRNVSYCPVLREFSPKSWRLQSRGRGLSEGRETSTYAGIRPADVTMSKVLNTEEDGDRPGKYTPVCLLQVEVAGDKQACCDVSSAF